MSTSKSQPSQFSSSIESGLVETRIVRNQPQEVYIGKHLVAIARIQDCAGGSCGLVLEFESIDGNIRRCIVSRGDFVGRRTKKVFESLLVRGYHYERKQREALIAYLFGLGAELPEIIANEITRLYLDLDNLVFDGDSSND